MNGMGSSITRIPIALYTAIHMCALMLTPTQIDLQMADAAFCNTSAVIKNYQSSEIFSRGLSESRRRALLVLQSLRNILILMLSMSRSYLSSSHIRFKALSTFISTSPTNLIVKSTFLFIQAMNRTFSYADSRFLESNSQQFNENV